MSIKGHWDRTKDLKAFRENHDRTFGWPREGEYDAQEVLRKTRAMCQCEGRGCVFCNFKKPLDRHICLNCRKVIDPYERCQIAYPIGNDATEIKGPYCRDCYEKLMRAEGRNPWP